MEKSTAHLSDHIGASSKIDHLGTLQNQRKKQK